jgi:phage gp46-like protein
MSDIRIINVSNLNGIWADWLLLPNGALDESQQLANIVKLALLTHALASTDDILPDPDSTDRRGWWAASCGCSSAPRSHRLRRAKAQPWCAPNNIARLLCSR